MKSTIDPSLSPPTIPYPKLMKGGSGCVYLMTSSGTGTAVGGEVRIGDRHTGLNMGKMEDFHGTVTLSNN